MSDNSQWAPDHRGLDPRWEWTEVTSLGDLPKRRWAKCYCNHLEAIPIESSGEVVAHLCLTCDEQLPAEWKP